MKLLRLLCIPMLLITVITGCNPSHKSNSEYYLYVGTYTRDASQGIYEYKFDASDGSLKQLGVTKGVTDPSYLAISPDHHYLYAVNEYRYSDRSGGELSAFSISKDDGALTPLNTVSTHGTSPCYVSVDQTGHYAFAANYSSGSFSMFPINSDGSLDSASVSVQHHGSSVNKDRQSSPHVHCTHLTPDNRFLIVDDLGTDQVYQYAFAADSGALHQQPVHQYEVKPGAGPRHITFSPNGKYAYLVTEMGGLVYGFKCQDNELHPIQSISTLPEGYDGQISGADIHVSPDGKFLYTSMREDLNQIVYFKIDQQSGRLTLAGRHSSGGVRPRNFMIDPTGKYLLAANMNSDNIVVFKRDKTSGGLTPAGIEAKLSMPVCLKIVPVQ